MRVTQSQADSLQDGIKVFEHFMIPEPKNLVTHLIEVGGSLLISYQLLSVLSPIYFDHKFSLKTAEISNVGSKFMLTTKFKTRKLTISQGNP